MLISYFVIFFFFNDTATTEIYTLSLHDALPIFAAPGRVPSCACSQRSRAGTPRRTDRKSTRLNSSHSQISYAVFCLKKKKKKKQYLLLNKVVHTWSHQASSCRYVMRDYRQS